MTASKCVGMAEMLAISLVMMETLSMAMAAVQLASWRLAGNASEEILGILMSAESCVVMVLT